MKFKNKRSKKQIGGDLPWKSMAIECEEGFNDGDFDGLVSFEELDGREYGMENGGASEKLGNVVIYAGDLKKNKKADKKDKKDNDKDEEEDSEKKKKEKRKAKDRKKKEKKRKELRKKKKAAKDDDNEAENDDVDDEECPLLIPIETEIVSKSSKRKAKEGEKNKKIKKAKTTNGKGFVVTSIDGESDEEIDDESESLGEQESDQADQGDQGESWRSLSLPDELVASLLAAKMFTPTEIQKATIPAAITERANIFGAAPTGSGKTLAFALPMITNILEDRKSDSTRRPRGLILTPTRELAVQIKKHVDAITKGTGISTALIVGGLAIQKQERVLEKFKPEVIIATPGRLWQIVESGKIQHLCRNSLRKVNYLVIDEADRMVEKSHFEELGQIIESLSGRDVKEDDVGKLEQGNYRKNKGKAVVDESQDELENELEDEEADEEDEEEGDFQDEEDDEAEPMDEEDAEEELDDQEGDLDDIADGLEEPEVSRQYLIFSATLTMLKKKDKFPKKNKKSNEENQQNLMRLLGLTQEDLVICDLTYGGAQSTPSSTHLTERIIHTMRDDKDAYLYYFLLSNPGRSIVFCNSIDCIRRLTNIFKFLEVSTIIIHSSMAQKRRLLSIERFTKLNHCVLLATDVASRGLDIPGVDHVIHYQVPRSAEIYVHRSGRTARINTTGLSLILSDPQEEAWFMRNITKVLNKTEIQEFETNSHALKKVKDRLALAIKCDKLEHQLRKLRLTDDWFRSNRKACEMDDSDDELGDDPDENLALAEKNKDSRKLKALTGQLKGLLREVIKFDGGRKVIGA